MNLARFFYFRRNRYDLVRLTVTSIVRVSVREYGQIQPWSLTPGACWEKSLGQGSRTAARAATVYTWARGGACRHGGIRVAPYTMRGSARPRGLQSSSSSKQQQQQQQQRRQEIRPYCLIPLYNIRGSTVVLLAAEPKGPLTLVRPCVRCCSALWAWGCTAVRFVREAKAPRWADVFFGKG